MESVNTSSCGSTRMGWLVSAALLMALGCAVEGSPGDAAVGAGDAAPTGMCLAMGDSCTGGGVCCAGLTCIAGRICGEESVDAATSAPDSGVGAMTDASAPGPDAGAAGDGGTSAPDGGATAPDAGPPGSCAAFREDCSALPCCPGTTCRETDVGLACRD